MLASVLDEFPDPALPEVSYQLSGIKSRDELLKATVDMLGRLVPSDGVCRNAVDIVSGEVEVIGEPAQTFNDPVVSQLLLELDDHPMIVSYLSQLLQPILATLGHGIPTPRDDPEGDELGSVPALTPREVEVLELVADGLSADACAHVLRISAHTVRKHLENAYAKLGCHDRLVAVDPARRYGLVPPY